MTARLRPIPEGLLDSGTRHLFVFAHQDDDLGYSGLLHRVAPDSSVVWVTNGDGLAPEANMEPEEYASMRTSEAAAALSVLGVEETRLHFLGHSEIAIYDDFKELAQNRGKLDGKDDLRDRVLHRMQSIHRRLSSLMEQADVVWCNAWQGGHPEHDLVHFLTAMAVADARKQGRDVRFMEVPEYEILFFVPLRFAPWFKGTAHVLELSPGELELKQRAFAAYASQKDITEGFRKLISLYGWINAVRLRPFDFQQFASKEYFAPVPLDRDYARSTHRLDLLDYINERHQGCRISFSRSVRPMVQLFRKSR